MNPFIETLNHWGGNFLDFAGTMLWQSSLLIVILFAFDFLFRRKIRASIRYALWLVLLLKLILPPTLALPTSPVWWLHKTSAAVQIKPQFQNFTVTYDSQPLPEIPKNWLTFTPSKPKLALAAWFLLVSVSISAGLLVWLLARWWQIARQARRAILSERLTVLANETRQFAGMKFKSNPPVKLTANTMSPAVCGLFRPVILIPQSLAENFSDEQLRAVLLHELIHLRRHDGWLNFLQSLLQIFYWWQPLVWLANARIRRAREEAVDDAVMLALRGAAETYAPTLLEVAKLALNRPLASLGLVGILESRSALRQRIERLVNFSAPRKAGLTIVSVLGILVFSAVAVPMGGAPTNENTNGISEQKIAQMKLVQDAKLDYESGKFDDAEKLLKSALANDPTDAAVKYFLNQVQAARINQTNSISGRQKIVEKLNRIRLDINYDNLPLSEVMRQLAELSKFRDPEHKGVIFLINPNPDFSGQPMVDPTTGLPTINSTPTIDLGTKVTITLNLTNVSLAEILDDIVKFADHPLGHQVKYSIEDYGVVFGDKGANTPQLFTRTFKMNTNRFPAVLKEQTGLPTDNSTNITRAARVLFSKAGIDWESPKGKAVFYNERLGLLFVKATLSDFDKIEHAIEMLNQDASQNQNQSPFSFGANTNALPAGGTATAGVLTNSNFLAALQSLKQKTGVESLDEPTKVTRSTHAMNRVDEISMPVTKPQIHIKAQFLEVSKGALDGMEKIMAVPNQTNQSAGIVGILTNEKFQTILYNWESRPDVENLAEPEAITTSGRQTQMRATQVITVITNFVFQENYANILTNGVAQMISNAVFPQTTQVETGPIFDVVPYVLSDDYTIHLDAVASLTEFLGYDNATNTKAAYTSEGARVDVPTVKPLFEVRQAKAQLDIRDGQTIVMRGLIPSAAQNLIGKHPAVPTWLRYQTKNGPEKELLIFVTVTIVDPAGNRVHSDVAMPFAQTGIPSQSPPLN